MTNQIEEQAELIRRAGGEQIVESMQGYGFKLCITEHNTYGYWFNQDDQMTIGLPQAIYMLSLLANQKEKWEKEAQKIYKKVRSNSRLILYTDTIGQADEHGHRDWAMRDDLWAISTKELDKLAHLSSKEKES